MLFSGLSAGKTTKSLRLQLFTIIARDNYGNLDPYNFAKVAKPQCQDLDYKDSRAIRTNWLGFFESL